MSVPRAAKEIRDELRRSMSRPNLSDKMRAELRKSMSRCNLPNHNKEAAPDMTATPSESTKKGCGSAHPAVDSVNESAAQLLKEEFGVEDAVAAFALIDSGHDLTKARTFLRQILPPDYLGTAAEHGGESSHMVCYCAAESGVLGKRVQELTAQEVARLVYSYGGSEEVAEGIVQCDLDGSQLSRSLSLSLLTALFLCVYVCARARVHAYIPHIHDLQQIQKTSARVASESAAPNVYQVSDALQFDSQCRMCVPRPHATCCRRVSASCVKAAVCQLCKGRRFVIRWEA
jgi:hypothetical protein